MIITPVVLRRSLDIDELISNRWCDALHFLGSYWPGALDAQSRIVKSFKKPDRQQSCLTPSLAFAYSEMIAPIAMPEKPDAIIRVLASKETTPEPSRPISILAETLTKKLRVPDKTGLFYRTDGREPMRSVERLAGSEAIRARLQYVLQDIFIKPEKVGNIVLLVDDIYNLGATVNMYSAALKRYCGVKKIISVNLAATRFARGKDGRGNLSLDIDLFASYARRVKTREITDTWGKSDPFEVGFAVEESFILHKTSDCPTLAGKTARRTLLYLLGPSAQLCPECFPPKRRFQLFPWLK